MNEPRSLVEHFFRHEFGRFVAVLTRSLGVRRLELVEDVVQAALVQALETWSRRGAWNWSDVREGMAWLASSAAGDELTRHLGGYYKTMSSFPRRTAKF